MMTCLSRWMRWCGLAVVLAGMLAMSCWGDVRLADVIGDHMVLQRDKVLPIWGWAAPGEEVLVTLGEQEAVTTADDAGEWMVRLKPLGAGGPYEMMVTGRNTIRLTDILVGEVWLCSGQSNMEWPLHATENAETAIAEANYPAMRLYHVGRAASGTPLQKTGARWQVCTSETAKGFSAVGYFFGRKVHRDVGIPVGLIEAAWGGTRIEPWTPPAGFAGHDAFADVLMQKANKEKAYRDGLESKLQGLEEWVSAARAAVAAGTVIPARPAWPNHPYDSRTQPTGLYNAMVHPVVPYALRGAIWYQGEANLRDGMVYRERMEALIGGWREVWGQVDFPFYYVQLAPYRYGGASPDLLPIIWSAQLKTLGVVNTGMAVTTDITMLHDIHPRNKLDVGERLALWALAKTYGQEGLVYSGPLYRGHTVEGAKVRVRFEHVGSGLATSDGAAVSWFEVAGADGEFAEAEAVIEGDTVVVWSDAVAAPEKVRMGWDQLAQPNLVNKEGLPASPFSSEH